MRLGRREFVVSLVLGGALAAGLGAVSVADTSPLKNSGFETNTFKNWKVLEQGGGNWHVYRKGDDPPGEVEPRGGGGLNKYPDPPNGKRAAFVFQESPGLNILSRLVKPKPDAANTLSFFLFYRNTADDFAAPNNFDFESEKPMPRGKDSDTNQQLRVDLLKRRAPLDSLKDKHVLATVLRTRPGDDKRRPYKRLKIDLTELGIKQRFRLRIAEVDNSGPLYVGVDGLKLKFE